MTEKKHTVKSTMIVETKPVNLAQHLRKLTKQLNNDTKRIERTIKQINAVKVEYKTTLRG